jgi:hypothetical protein
LLNKQVAQQWRQDGQKGAELWDLAGDYQLIQGQRGHERNVARDGRSEVNVNVGSSGRGQARRQEPRRLSEEQLRENERARKYNAGKWVDVEDAIYGKHQARKIRGNCLDKRGNGWFVKTFYDPRTKEGVDTRVFIVCNYVYDVNGNGVLDIPEDFHGVKTNFGIDEKVTIYFGGSKPINNPSYKLLDRNGDVVDQISFDKPVPGIVQMFSPEDRTEKHLGKYRALLDDGHSPVSIEFEVTE